MEIKNGLVQWNGRNDIPCSYVDLEDGTRYYIKQDLVNGNYIVTTALLEVVDAMAKAKSIGLIDAEGKMLIPTVNSSIKVVDDILLVEPAEAVSDNVKEAISLRMDPLAATRLVTTPAQIKEKIPANDYKFYNQFSEVAICDLNGNNLVNGEYFSFVAKDGDKLYLAKNNVDTEIKEFSITDKKLIEAKQEEIPSTEVTTEVVQSTSESVVPIVENTSVVPETEVTDDIGEDISIPEGDVDFSFDNITEETPTEVVSAGEGVEVDIPNSEDKSADIETRLSALNKTFSGMNNDIDTVLQNNKDIQPQDVFANTDFKVDSIDVVDDEPIKNELPADDMEDDTTVKEFVKAFEDLRLENANKDRELSEARVIIEKQKDTAAKDKARIRSLEQKNELATSTINDLREALAKQSAEAERAKNAADIYKGKADGYKYELAEKDREIERLKSQDKALDYIRDTLERYKAAKDIDNIYKDIDEEDTYYKVA